LEAGAGLDEVEEEEDILNIDPYNVSTYRLPSSGPTCKSVITPNPLPNIIPPCCISSGVFATLSASGLPSPSSSPVLCDFSLKLNRSPVSTYKDGILIRLT